MQPCMHEHAYSGNPLRFASALSAQATLHDESIKPADDLGTSLYSTPTKRARLQSGDEAVAFALLTCIYIGSRRGNNRNVACACAMITCMCLVHL